MPKPRLLIVDDEVGILNGFSKYFSALGYEVHCASSGEEGLVLFDRVTPDVTILDVKMPGLSGMEVLKILRDQDATVIMLTGVDAGDTASEALRLGAINFFLKPVDLPRLAVAVNHAAGVAPRPR